VPKNVYLLCGFGSTKPKKGKTCFKNKICYMALIITDDTLAKAKLSAEELLIDLACYLYDKKRISMGQGRQLTGLDQISFQKELAKRDINIHYTSEDLDKDLKNLGISL
jgi:predicted HTH domain antitoxin